MESQKTTLHFSNVDERNNFIVECYNQGKKYVYYDKNKCEDYIVEVYEGIREI